MHENKLHKRGDDMSIELKKLFYAQHVNYRKSQWLFIFTGFIVLISNRYGSRAIRYFFLEAGHSAQNMVLLCCLLKIPHITLGAFKDDLLRKELRLNGKYHPLYCILM